MKAVGWVYYGTVVWMVKVALTEVVVCYVHSGDDAKQGNGDEDVVIQIEQYVVGRRTA